MDEPGTLAELCNLVHHVAPEKQVVLRGDGERVPHEHGGVHNQGRSHRTRNRLFRLVLEVKDRSNRNPEVRDRAPEVGREDVLEGLLAEDLLRKLLSCRVRDRGRHICSFWKSEDGWNCAVLIWYLGSPFQLSPDAILLWDTSFLPISSGSLADGHRQRASPAPEAEHGAHRTGEEYADVSVANVSGRRGNCQKRKLERLDDWRRRDGNWRPIREES